MRATPAFGSSGNFTVAALIVLNAENIKVGSETKGAAESGKRAG